MKQKKVQKTVYVFPRADGRLRVRINKEPPEGAPFLMNPDLSAVDGLPPEKWAIVEGKVVPRVEGIVYRFKNRRRLSRREWLLVGFLVGSLLSLVA